MLGAKPSLWFVLALPVFTLACGGGNNPSGGGGGGDSQPNSISITAGNKQTAVVGTTLPTPLSVQVSTASGQPAANVAVAWIVATGNGSFAKISATTDSNGMATAQWKIGTKAGTNSVTAAVSPLAPVTFTATGTAGPLAQLILTNPKNPLVKGDAAQISVSGSDQYGNAVAGVTPAWSATPGSVVTINATGQLTAIGSGGGFVSAVSGTVSVTLPVVVNGNITFTIGPEEVVYSYETQRCDDSDVPDEAAKAVRLADGTLMLTASNAPNNYALFGADFSSLTRDCSSPALTSVGSPLPNTFANLEWLTTPYRVGSTIHALIHNEFHDAIAPNCAPGDPNPGNPCWYNSILYANSTDGGHSYTQASAPAQVVAPPAAQWNPGPPTPGPYGYFNPSNIVLSPDGNYYSVFMSIDTSGTQGMCVMRTLTLTDPTSWRAWDGTGYNLQMTDPYTSSPQWCKQVFTGGLPGSLTFNTYLNKYILVADIATPVGCGTAFVTSSDLINWSALSWLRAIYFPFTNANSAKCAPPPGVASIAYSSFIDHTDTTTNFEKPGQNLYLYYTRFNPPTGPNRDLVRVAVTIH